VSEMVEIAGQPPLGTGTVRPGEAPRLPLYTAHVFVCMGRRCLMEGNHENYQVLMELLEQRGLLCGQSSGASSNGQKGPVAIKVTRSKCLSPCNGAPVMCIYPSGEYVWGIGPEKLESFVEEVLVNGRPLSGHTFRPGE